MTFTFSWRITKTKGTMAKKVLSRYLTMKHQVQRNKRWIIIKWKGVTLALLKKRTLSPNIISVGGE